VKENTKYHNYRFIGSFNIEEIQPWFDFASLKPWDEGEIPWILDNKVRREILISLANGSKNFNEICKSINFKPKPLLVLKEEYDPKITFQWSKETIENHLLNLEWYNLVERKNDKYELSFPILSKEKIDNIEKFVLKFASNWIKIIKDLKSELNKNLEYIKDNQNYLQIIIEKAIEKLYESLKKENILPNIPNLKILWAEQLRKIKFKDWIAKNF